LKTPAMSNYSEK